MFKIYLHIHARVGKKLLPVLMSSFENWYTRELCVGVYSLVGH